MKVYAIPGSSRCLVKLLDKYLEKLPLDAQYVYMRPLDKIPTIPTKPWYTKQRVGYNTLKGFTGLHLRGGGHSPPLGKPSPPLNF